MWVPGGGGGGGEGTRGDKTRVLLVCVCVGVPVRCAVTERMNHIRCAAATGRMRGYECVRMCLCVHDVCVCVCARARACVRAGPYA